MKSFSRLMRLLTPKIYQPSVLELQALEKITNQSCGTSINTNGINSCRYCSEQKNRYDSKFEQFEGPELEFDRKRDSFIGSELKTRKIEIVDEYKVTDLKIVDDFQEEEMNEQFDDDVDDEGFDDTAEEDFASLSTKELFNLIKPSLREGRKLKHYIHSTFHLQVLVAIFGVNIYRVDLKNNNEMRRILLRTSIENDVIPRLNILQSYMEISLSDLGTIIGKCPHILEHPLESIVANLNYYKRCNFPSESMKKMFVKHPRSLLMEPTAIDETLSVLQRMTDLPAQVLKSIVIETPRLITTDLDRITWNRNLFRDKILFDVNQFHAALKRCPEILLIRCEELEEKYYYLSQQMRVSNELISHNAEVFKKGLNNVKTLNLFLKSLNRNQYDPSKPLYISLKYFCFDDIIEACNELSLSSDQLMSFMRTM